MDIPKQITLARKDEGTNEDVTRTRSISSPNSRTGRTVCQFAEDRQIGRRGGSLAARQNFVAVGSVKIVMVTLDLHVISMPKAKKKPKKKARK